MSTTDLETNNTTAQHQSNHAISADTVRNELLSQLEPVLLHLLPHGCLRHNTYEVGDINGNPGDSLKVEVTGGKAGLWHDFATGEGGDILDLWAARYHFDTKTQFAHVLRSASSWLGLQPNAPTNDSVSHSHHYDTLGAPTAKWDYCNAEGQLIACVYRYDTPEGKQYRPWDVINRKNTASNPRPLYNQPGIKKATQVVLVEGEKAASSLIEQGIAATTAMFGAKASVTKTDWSPLTGKHVIIWPDNDAAGKHYAHAVSQHLANSGLLLSLCVLSIPADKPEKWDAADAFAQGVDAKAFIASNTQSHRPIVPLLPAYTLRQLLDDTSPMPTDLIAPRVLTPSGLMVLGGAPKVGKSDFLLSLLSHMAAGIPFLGLTPPRPLRIFYLQTEIGYHYLRERCRTSRFDDNLPAFAPENLVITPQSNLLLNKEGVGTVKRSILAHFPDEPVDMIVVDPLRNVYDRGDDEQGENSNDGMLFFLTKRLEALRSTLNPDAGIILVHHTRKMQKKQLEADPFQALAGASSLRGYYTTGTLLFKEDEQLSPRKLVFELRNGRELEPKCIDKVNGQWRELDANSKRIVKDKYARKLEAECKRKQNVILQLIYEEARLGRLYTINQFSEAFENTSGLGGTETIRKRLNALATRGVVKFSKDTTLYKIKNPLRTKFGFLCVEGMQFSDGKTHVHPDTGETLVTLQPVFPTHYKCKQTADALPVKDKFNWDYIDEGAA